MNSGVPKGYVIPAPLVTSVIYLIKVRIPSQENKWSCLFMSVVSVLPLFLRYLDYALEFVQQCAFLLCIFIFLTTIAIWNFDDYCKNFHLSPYKSITNTTWVHTLLCKLQKKVRSTRSRKWSSLPVACPWSVVLSGYSGFFHHWN